MCITIKILQISGVLDLDSKLVECVAIVFLTLDGDQKNYDK